MARLVLSVDEALALGRSQRPLPPEVESIGSSGDTLLVKIDPRAHLPKLLRRLGLKLNLTLRFDTFGAGRAAFKVDTSLSALPVTTLVQLLLKLVSLPEMKGITLAVGEKETGEGLTAWVDLQTLVNEQVRGVTVTDFRLVDNCFVVDVAISELTLKDDT